MYEIRKKKIEIVRKFTRRDDFCFVSSSLF